MTVYKVKIKSSITPYVWYFDKVGETFEGVKHKTESLFWFPGNVFKTPQGYIHEQDAEVISEYSSPIEPIQNN